MKKGRRGVVVSLILLGGALLITYNPAWGQTGRASISGTVDDPSGSVIPAVTITATNTSTNVSYKAETNSAGVYYIGALPIGPYTLVGRKAGFKQWRRDLQLEVGQSASINLILQVGSPRTIVQVTGAPPILNTTGSQVGDVMDYQRIQQLPLNGRSVGNLFQLTPGVEGGAGGARVNGMKVGSLGISLDGITERDRYGGGMVREQPDIQDIQEFAVDTSGMNARYANPAQVIMKTRSGTNQLHGELFETHRNNTGGLLARLRQQKSGEPFPKDIRNEFGGDIGGPVYLPHLYNGHNKTFFYFSYEGHREVGRAGLSLDGPPIVPTPAMWNGDLSNTVSPRFSSNKVQIYNPYTTDPTTGQRQPFVGNIIPPDMISPIAKFLEPITAPPSNSIDPYQGRNFTGVYPTSDTENKFTAKVDQNFSDKDRVSVRWSRESLLYAQDGGNGATPISPSYATGTYAETSSVTNVGVEYTRTISNSQLNELTLGVLRTPTHDGTLADNILWANKLGLPNPFGAAGWPTVCAGPPYICWDAQNPDDDKLTTYHGADNYTWIKGRHTIQFGGSFNREQNNIRQMQQAQGSDAFGGSWTCQFDPVAQACQPNTGSGFADLLLGIPGYLSNEYNRGYFYFRQSDLAGYINDQWRATRRLTLNLGVRWDKFTPYTEKENRMAVVPLESALNNFEVVTPVPINTIPGVPPAVLQSWSARGLQYVTASQIGYPTNLFAADNNNFGPRLGAAFKINDKTVVRGGYGIYYWPMPLGQILTTARLNPPLNLRFANEFLGPGSCGYGSDFNYTMTNQPSQGNLLPAQGGTVAVCTTGLVQISPGAQGTLPFDLRNWRNDKMQNWNISLERELPYQTTLRLSYIGNHGTNLDQRMPLNNRLPQITYAETTGQAPPSNKDLLRPNPNWNFAYGVATQDGFSYGDSAQINLEHKYRNGMVFQFFYVWSRDLTTTDIGGFNDANMYLNNGSGGAAPPENRQILGQPNLDTNQLLNLVYYNSTNVPAQHYGWNGLVNLPFGHGKKFLTNAHGALNQLVGGWQVAFLGNWVNGYWMSVNQGDLTTGNPRLNSSQRLKLNYGGGQQELWFAGNFDPTQATNVQGGQQALENLVNPNVANRIVRPYGPDCNGNYSGDIAVTLANGSCFNAPSNDFYNGSPKGSILGPSAFSMDASMFKNFSITERAKLRFTADFFNVFNHPTNNYPDSNTGLIDLSTQANSPRLIQFSLHLIF